MDLGTLDLLGDEVSSEVATNVLDTSDKEEDSAVDSNEGFIPLSPAKKVVKFFGFFFVVLFVACLCFCCFFFFFCTSLRVSVFVCLCACVCVSVSVCLCVCVCVCLRVHS